MRITPSPLTAARTHAPACCSALHTAHARFSAAGAAVAAANAAAPPAPVALPPPRIALAAAAVIALLPAAPPLLPAAPLLLLEPLPAAPADAFSAASSLAALAFGFGFDPLPPLPLPLAPLLPLLFVGLSMPNRERLQGVRDRVAVFSSVARWSEHAGLRRHTCEGLA